MNTLVSGLLRPSLSFKALFNLPKGRLVILPFYDIEGGVARYGENTFWESQGPDPKNICTYILLGSFVLVDADGKPLHKRSVSAESFDRWLKGPVLEATIFEIEAARRQREENLIAALNERIAKDQQALVNAKARLRDLHPNAKT